MDSECKFFGAIQKPYGMETIMGNMTSIFLDRGIDANMAICPADTAALLRCRQETRDFMLNGALAQLYQYVLFLLFCFCLGRIGIDTARCDATQD